MEKESKQESKLFIFKQPGFLENKCITGLDAKRDKEFNSGKAVSVSKDELEKLIKFRWLGVKDG